VVFIHAPQWHTWLTCTICIKLSPFAFYFLSPPPFLLCTIVKQQILRTASCISRLYHSVFCLLSISRCIFSETSLFWLPFEKFLLRISCYWCYRTHVMVRAPQKHAHQKLIWRCPDMVMLYLCSCLRLSWNNKLSACCCSFLHSVIN
jgi:hypothetical protein